MRRIIFGSGNDARDLLKNIPKSDVSFILDNDENRWGKCIENIPIVSPYCLQGLHYDIIHIAARKHTMKIERQLRDLGVEPSKITSPLLSPDNVSSLKSLIGKHKNSPAIFIGNGPTLILDDLRKIENSKLISFGFNKIFKAYAQVSFRPTYYLVEDWLVVENNHKQINDLKGSTKLIPEQMLHLLSKREGDIIFGQTYEPLNTNEIFISEEMTNICWGGTVVYSAYQIARLMGCNPIILVGVDLVYPSTGDSEAQVLLAQENQGDHFITNYHEPGERWNKPDMSRIWSAMASMKRNADQEGIDIINATRGGALHFFKRAPLDHFL